MVAVRVAAVARVGCGHLGLPLLRAVEIERRTVRAHDGTQLRLSGIHLLAARKEEDAHRYDTIVGTA